jgi:dihydroorotate dehydrogenase (NAD+) catalytic subunit
VAAAVEGAGADAVSLINTLRSTAIAPDGRGPWLGGERGGLSGPAVRAVALSQVAEVAEAVSIPVVGMGGISRGCHALDFIRAGATAVAVGTESFRDPEAGARVARELACELDAAGLDSVASARTTFGHRGPESLENPSQNP